MLEFGDSAPQGQDLIKDTTEATFMADVIDASKDVPVIVDFWAEWCGPCRQLGPALEGAVKKAGGKVRMVKVDVDKNQGIAGQLQVQSIPTVFAFHNGQPVDGFQGALAQSQVDEFVQKIAALAGGGDGDEALTAALEAGDEFLEAGNAAEAVEHFAHLLQAFPECAPAYAGLARAYIALEQPDQAEAVVNGVPAEISEDPVIEAVRSAIALARQAQDAGPVAELRASSEANADDHQARFDLAVALHASGDTQGAIDELLELFRRDREWNDEAAKSQLFVIFDALKPGDPIAINGRRKLSSMIFA